MDTPRTDAILRAARITPLTIYGDFEAALELSCTLERELSAKTAECQRLREALERLVDTVDPPQFDRKTSRRLPAVLEPYFVGPVEAARALIDNIFPSK